MLPPLRRAPAPAVLDALAARIRALEGGVRPQGQATAPLGGEWGRLLPAGGLPCGSLLELLVATEGSGAAALALTLARQAAGGRRLVVVDPQRGFHPPAALAWGLDWRRLLVVRPTPRAGPGAMAQALRCGAVGAVLGWFEALSGEEARKLQLAAEDGGGLGLLLRPAMAGRQPSFAAARWAVAPLPSRADGVRRLTVEAVRLRGAGCGGRLVLEIDDAAGVVRPTAAVAAPAADAG